MTRALEGSAREAEALRRRWRRAGAGDAPPIARGKEEDTKDSSERKGDPVGARLVAETEARLAAANARRVFGIGAGAKRRVGQDGTPLGTPTGTPRAPR